MLKIDDAMWNEINKKILDYCHEIDRRGAALLYALPFFGAIILAAAYWGIPETKVPALIVLVLMIFAVFKIYHSRQKLQKKNILLLRAAIKEKKEIRVSHSDRSDSVSHDFLLEEPEAIFLNKAGEMSPAPLPGVKKYKTTKSLFDLLKEGCEIWAAVRPHDNGIYFVIDDNGTLKPDGFLS